jgi:hypothetical protein
MPSVCGGGLGGRGKGEVLSWCLWAATDSPKTRAPCAQSSSQFKNLNLQDEQLFLDTIRGINRDCVK